MIQLTFQNIFDKYLPEKLFLQRSQHLTQTKQLRKRQTRSAFISGASNAAACILAVSCTFTVHRGGKLFQTSISTLRVRSK